MLFYLDTAIISEVERFVDFGVVDGITTNPTLIARSGADHHEVIGTLARMIEGPVSAEVLATDVDEMVEEGVDLSTIRRNVVVKLPCTKNGFMACNKLSLLHVATNMTLCFSTSQAMLACKAGASYISPFIGRVDDAGGDGIKLVSDIVGAIANSGYYTNVIAASIRNQHHVERCMQVGADIATIPPALMDALFDHPLTDSGVATFLKDSKGT